MILRKERKPVNFKCWFMLFLNLETCNWTSQLYLSFSPHTLTALPSSSHHPSQLPNIHFHSPHNTKKYKTSRQPKQIQPACLPKPVMIYIDYQHLQQLWHCVMSCYAMCLTFASRIHGFIGIVDRYRCDKWVQYNSRVVKRYQVFF